MPHAPLPSVLAAVAASVTLTLGLTTVPDDRPPEAPPARVEALAAAPAVPLHLTARVEALVDAATSTTAIPTTTTTASTTTTTAPPSPPPTTSPPTTAPPPPPTTAPAPPAPPPETASTTTSCDGTFRSWTNDARAAAGVAGLAGDGAIAHVPANWSRHMADTNSLRHNPNYFDQIRRSRPEARTGAENVGYSTEGTRAVFDAFMNSSGHRANILAGDKTFMATACVVDGTGRTWVTMNFWG